MGLFWPTASKLAASVIQRLGPVLQLVFAAMAALAFGAFFLFSFGVTPEHFRSWRSICSPSCVSDYFYDHIPPYPPQYATNYTEADKTNAQTWMYHTRESYVSCYEQAAVEVISLGGTDIQAKSQADNSCRQELSNYRRDIELVHLIDRRMNSAEAASAVQADAARADAERDVAELSQSVELRIEAFRLCHANRNQWGTKYSCFGIFPSSWCGAV